MSQLPSYSNNGRVKNPNTNNTFFSANDLDPDTYFTVIDMKVGDICKPMEIKMPDGQKAYRLVRLNSTTKPHRANLREDYDKISNFAKENKKNEYYMKWINDKKSKTFISIDSLFAHCENKLKG
jgi:peptidyl-prolyl cis-trans isomerase SurA